MATSVGPFRVLGRFNSERSPEIIYTVKEHLAVDKESDKRLSCNCLGWRFALRTHDNHQCKHTRYVQEHQEKVSKDHPDYKDQSLEVLAIVERNRFNKTEIGRALNRPQNSAKSRLAHACDAAGVKLSDAAFKALLRELRPYLLGQITKKTTAQKAWDTRHANANPDDVLRVITLD